MGQQGRLGWAVKTFRSEHTNQMLRTCLCRHMMTWKPSAAVCSLLVFGLLHLCLRLLDGFIPSAVGVTTPGQQSRAGPVVSVHPVLVPSSAHPACVSQSLPS